MGRSARPMSRPCTHAPISRRTRPSSSSLSHSLGVHVPSTRVLRLASVCSVLHRKKGAAGGWGVPRRQRWDNKDVGTWSV
jgi:hypothetical protein